MLAFFANITPHGKGDSNLVEVKDSIGNITYQKEIGNWTGRKNELQRNIVDFENTFLANYEKDKSITKTNKVRAKPVIILQDARDKEASGDIWKENQAQTGLRLDIMIRIGKVVMAVSVPKEPQALMSARFGRVKIFG